MSESESEKSEDEEKPLSEHETDVEETHFIEDPGEDLSLVRIAQNFIPVEFVILFCTKLRIG